MEPTSTPEVSGNREDIKTTAILAWVFAPLTSFMWKDHQNEFIRFHARESLYLGIANIAVVIVLTLLQVCMQIFAGALFFTPAFALFGLISCFFAIIWLGVTAFIVVPRVVGVIKAANMEKWEVPYVSRFVSRYIKL